MAQVEHETDVDDTGLQVAAAIRELRRTIQSGALRSRAYGDIVDLRQMDALDVLSECDGLRVGELAVALRVDNSTATRAVQQLEGRGLVLRAEDRRDARATVVELTADGRARQAEVRAKRRLLMSELLRDFTPAERLMLIELISRLVAVMDREAGASRPRRAQQTRATELAEPGGLV